MAESYGFCDYAEYAAGETRRVHEADLSLGGIYVVMYRLWASGDGPQAARQPARLMETGTSVSLSYVRFLNLSPDMRPISKQGAFIEDGYISSMGGHLYVNGVQAGEAYFQGYEFDSGWNMSELTELTARKIPIAA